MTPADDTSPSERRDMPPSAPGPIAGITPDAQPDAIVRDALEGRAPKPARPDRDPPTDEVLILPRRDRWNHRRGEPRAFALLWTCFLLLTTVLGFVQFGRGPLEIEQYRPVGRIMLVSVAMGIMLLWPMLRLSQTPPREGAFASTLRDLPIMLVPTQAVIWPQVWLGRWSWEAVGATSLVLAGWIVLVGGVLAMSQRPSRAWLEGPRDNPRLPVAHNAGLWMLALACVAFVAPAHWLLTGSSAASMASPVSAVFVLTADEWSVASSPAGAATWVCIAAVVVASGVLWSLGAAMDRRDQEFRWAGTHPPGSGL